MRHFFICSVICLLYAGCTKADSYKKDSVVSSASASSLFVKTYGDNRSRPVIFIHGGPGFDSQNFEHSTAQALADKGFFVLVYDQQGQGRSPLASSPQVYNYKTYSEDLYGLISQYNLNSPVLIGHSHGGPIALKFDEMYPGVASTIVLVSAPVNFWASMESISDNCAKKYKETNDTASLKNLSDVFSQLHQEKLSVEEKIKNVGSAFQHGMKCGLYQVKKPTPESEGLQKIISEKYEKVHPNNIIYPMGNFVIYENYYRLDHSLLIKKSSAEIHGVYGSEDGLFTTFVLKDIEFLLPPKGSNKRFHLIQKSSHNIFIDKQKEFLSLLEKIVKK